MKSSAGLDLGLTSIQVRRVLRFWQIGVDRTDTWRRVGGAWVLTPEKL